MIDQNVNNIRALLSARAIVGLKKYGVTTEREDLSTKEWIQHAIEEACDLAVYLERIKNDLEQLIEQERNTIDIRISSTGVAVDQTRFWMPMEDCPKGVKVQLLTASGVAVYGVLSDKNKDVFDGWHPLPKKPV